MKKIIACLLVLTLAIGMAACGAPATPSESAQPSEPAAPSESAQPSESAVPSESAEASASAGGGEKLAVPDAKGMKVGVLYCSLAAPAVKVFAQGIQEVMQESGAEIVELDSEFDAQKQTDQMNSLISQKVDAIVLNPVDGKSIIPAVKKAHEEGIPVVMGAMDIDESGREYVVSFVGADDTDVGRAAGKIMIDALGEAGGKVAIVEGSSGTSSQLQRTAGFEEAVAGSNIEIVAKLPADFDKAKAMTIAEDLFTKYQDLKGIWVHDDTMAVGVVQAMKSQGLTGDDVKIVSYNGSKAGADMIKSGEIIATAVQPLVEEGRNSMIVAINAAKGEQVEAWYKDVIVPLDKSNIDDYDPALLW